MTVRLIEARYDCMFNTEEKYRKIVNRLPTHFTSLVNMVVMQSFKNIMLKVCDSCSFIHIPGVFQERERERESLLELTLYITDFHL